MKTLFLILVLTFSAFAQSNEPLALGNPSDAKAKVSDADNYLVMHTGYVLSYNKSRGAANWVGWHLTKSDVGSAERSDAFAPDTTLPAADWWIKPNDYLGSGYDRGHMCPSKDRSATDAANRETFLMDNMQPQAPKLNRKTWNYLESYEREMTRSGSEAYIFAGCYGDKGKIAGKITIPTNCYKIIVVLPEGENDLKRIDKQTRVIAVDMPNDETVSQRWRTYRTTVDDIEAKTGYDFLSKVSKKVQKIIESAKDESSDTNQSDDDGEKPAAAPNAKDSKPDDKKAPAAKKTDSGGREYLTGARGGCYYLTASGKKSYVDKKFCESAAPSAASAAKPDEKQDAPKPDAAAEKPKDDAPKPASDGRTYIKGSRGGCYYLTPSGKKQYVNRELCGN